MATQENTSTINRVEACDLLELIQTKIEQIQAIAIAATVSNMVPEATLRELFNVVQTIAEDATEFHALKTMLEAAHV
jgi:hypothetical protein